MYDIVENISLRCFFIEFKIGQSFASLLPRVARSFIEDFGSCQNRITTLADGFASDAHLRTDLPKNKPTVSFLKASTAYIMKWTHSLESQAFLRAIVI